MKFLLKVGKDVVNQCLNLGLILIIENGAIQLELKFKLKVMDPGFYLNL